MQEHGILFILEGPGGSGMDTVGTERCPLVHACSSTGQEHLKNAERKTHRSFERSKLLPLLSQVSGRLSLSAANQALLARLYLVVHHEGLQGFRRRMRPSGGTVFCSCRTGDASMRSKSSSCPYFKQDTELSKGQCLETSLKAQDTCAPTNTTCICTNAPLMAAIQGCVLTSCTVKQALGTFLSPHDFNHSSDKDSGKQYNTDDVRCSYQGYNSHYSYRHRCLWRGSAYCCYRSVFPRHERVCLGRHLRHCSISLRTSHGHFGIYHVGRRFWERHLEHHT